MLSSQKHRVLITVVKNFTVQAQPAKHTILQHQDDNYNCKKFTVQAQPAKNTILQYQGVNRRATIRHHCWETTVLSCRRRLINTGVEKMNNI
jgi:hypothetical protein